MWYFFALCGFFVALNIIIFTIITQVNGLEIHGERGNVKKDRIGLTI